MNDKKFRIEGTYLYWNDRRPTEEELEWSFSYSNDSYYFIKVKGEVIGHLYIIGTNKLPMKVVRLGDDRGVFYVLPNDYEPTSIDGIPIVAKVETSHYYYMSLPYPDPVEFAVRYSF